MIAAYAGAGNRWPESVVETGADSLPLDGKR